MKKRITEEKFKELSSKIVGMPVSHAWRGYGSAIFLEFGKLNYSEMQNYPKGELTLAIEWSWRIENKRSIWLGSFSGDQKISNQLPKLTGTTVKGVSLFGRLPEICINLDDKHWISSFATEEGQPEWTLFLADDSWFHVLGGVLYHEKNEIAEQPGAL